MELGRYMSIVLLRSTASVFIVTLLGYQNLGVDFLEYHPCMFIYISKISKRTKWIILFWMAWHPFCLPDLSCLLTLFKLNSAEQNLKFIFSDKKVSMVKNPICGLIFLAFVLLEQTAAGFPVADNQSKGRQKRAITGLEVINAGSNTQPPLPIPLRTGEKAVFVINYTGRKLDMACTSTDIDVLIQPGLSDQDGVFWKFTPTENATVSCYFRWLNRHKLVSVWKVGDDAVVYWWVYGVLIDDAPEIRSKKGAMISWDKDWWNWHQIPNDSCPHVTEPVLVSIIIVSEH